MNFHPEWVLYLIMFDVEWQENPFLPDVETYKDF